MEELKNVQVAATDSEQDEKSAFTEDDYYYDKENEEVKYGDKTLGLKWFGFYRWVWMGLDGLIQLITIIVMIVTGAMKETIGADVSSWIYTATIIYMFILVGYRLILCIFLPKFTKTIYRANLIWLVLMPFVSLAKADFILWIRDCIVALLNVVYFQKRSFMFGIKKEDCKEKYTIKRLIGPVVVLILPMVLMLIVGIAGKAADERDAIVNAEDDYKMLAETVGFDSTKEMEKWLEENCDVDFSDMETFEKLEYVVSTNMGFASYEEAKGNMNPFTEEVIYDKGDYQRYLMDCVREDEEAYLYSDKEQISYVTPEIAKKTTKGTMVAKFNELATKLGYADYLELLQSLENWKEYEGLSPQKQFEKLAEEYGVLPYEEVLGYNSPYNNDLFDSFADYQDYVITGLTEE